MTLAVHEWGAHGDVPLILWRADGEPASRELARRLVAAGFRVVDVTEEAGEEAARAAERLDDLLDDRELDRPVLAGWARGSAVAVAYALAHPDDVRAVVLIDGTADPLVEAPTLLTTAHDDAALADDIAGWLVDQGL